ncbi:MAG: hypothetical protein HY787_24410, partial [Deltaproteobacteria bacterium]|nr:hypothetical protein [Deltaproteobacteria bacterium]
MKKIEISPDIKDGSFGLDELHEFFRKFAVEVKQIQRGEEVIIDLSQITFWDISALLWLIIALDYYQKEGQKSADVGTSQKYTLTLRLPQPSISSKTYEQMEKEDLALLKSA